MVGARTMAGCALMLAVAGGSASALGAEPMMHPRLGARLAGMGEHGIVNLRANADTGRLCWKFDLPGVTGVTGASIHAGARGAVLVKLGRTFRATGCVKASAMTLEHLEATPRKYWVLVDTAGHPGDLRGRLMAGVVRM